MVIALTLVADVVGFVLIGLVLPLASSTRIVILVAYLVLVNAVSRLYQRRA
jgi:uncharacterized protein YhhL (DUF1145 family)